MDWYSSKSALVPKKWMILKPGEKIKAVKSFTTHNVSDKFGLKRKSIITKIKKGSIGTVMGLTSPTSLSSTYVAKFGNRYVYIYDYNFSKGELKSI